MTGCSSVALAGMRARVLRTPQRVLVVSHHRYRRSPLVRVASPLGSVSPKLDRKPSYKNVQTFDGVEYVRVEEVDEMVSEACLVRQQALQSAVQSQDRLRAVETLLNTVSLDARTDEQLAMAKEVLRKYSQELANAQALNDSLNEKLAASHKEIAAARREANMATVRAEAALAERVEADMAKEYARERRIMEREMGSALKLAKDAQAAAAQAKVDAAIAPVEAAEDTARALESRTAAAVLLARTSASAAHEAAEKAQNAAQKALKQQQGTQQLMEKLRQGALEALTKANKAQEESEAMQAEVLSLREQLAQAREAEILVLKQRASALKDASSRVEEVERKAEDRIQAAETAFEALKRVERERAEGARVDCALLRSEVEASSEDNSQLREALLSAEQVVSQATSRADAAANAIETHQQSLTEDAQAKAEAQAEALKLAEERIRIEAQQQAQAMIDEAVRSAQEEVDRACSSGQTRLDALQRALAQTTAARNMWQNRAQQLDEVLQGMKRDFQTVLNEAVSEVARGNDEHPPGTGRNPRASLGKGRWLAHGKVAQASGRLQRHLQSAELREFLVLGPRSAVTGGESSGAVNGRWLPPREDWGIPYPEDQDR